MKTIVYVDGYNFYFGVLRGTPYKWLDIVATVKHICHIQNPNIDVTSVKFFTAPVITRLATQGEKSQQSQDVYHKALLNRHPETIEIINGYYLMEKGTPPKYKTPVDKKDRVDVWKLEEKQTDVNIALHLYRDAVQRQCEQAVLVSSDSDLESALKFISSDFPDHKIGLILPRRQSGDDKQRPANKSLSNYSDWGLRRVALHFLSKVAQTAPLPPQSSASVQ